MVHIPRDLWHRIYYTSWTCVYIVIAVCACACSTSPVGHGHTHLNNTLVNTTVSENEANTGTESGTYEVHTKTNNEIQQNSSKSDIFISLFNATHILPNVTTTNEPANSSDISDSDNDATVAKLNLAIIPGIAVFIFLVVMCLKCCKWFRQYTRADDKDSYGQTYNAIIQAGEADYDLVETHSETTSNNDTVSSFFSFLKRSGNESTLSSFRSMKSELSNDKNSLQAYYEKLSPNGTDNNDGSSKLSPLLTNEEKETVISPGRGKQTFCTSPCPKADQGTRTISVSSDETDQSIVSDTETTTFNKKNQRFKVSFVTEAEANSNKPAVATKSIPALRSIINNNRPSSFIVQANIEDEPAIVLKDNSSSELLKRRYSTTSMRSNSRKAVDIRSLLVNKDLKQIAASKSPYVRSNSGKIILHSNMLTPDEAPQTADVGTQTTKSFRYSLRRGRKRFPSDGGVDENQVPPTIRELTEMCQCTVPKCSSVKASSPKCRDCANTMNVDDDDVFDSAIVSHGSLNSSSDTKAGIDKNHDNSNRLNAEVVPDFDNGRDTGEDVVPISRLANCDISSNCDKHANDSCRAGGIPTEMKSADSVAKNQAVDMLFVTEERSSSLPKTFLKQGVSADTELSTKENAINSSTGKDNVLKCENGHFDSCRCCYNKVMTSNGTYTYDIKYCKLCILSGCTIREAAGSRDDEPVVGRVGPCMTRLKRDSSLASEDLSSSMTSLSSSGYADTSTGSCST